MKVYTFSWGRLYDSMTKMLFFKYKGGLQLQWKQINNDRQTFYKWKSVIILLEYLQKKQCLGPTYNSKGLT